MSSHIENKIVEVIQSIDLEDLSIVGDSITVLGRFAQEKLPISFGFVLTSNFLKNLISSNDIHGMLLSMKKTSKPDRKSFESSFKKVRISNEVADKIKTAYSRISGFSEIYVNLRAVIFDREGQEYATSKTYLKYDLRGEDDLNKGIVELYLEILSENINLVSKFLDEDIKIAVLVQKAVQSESHGTVYTSDIFTNDQNKIVIEALYGLESIGLDRDVIPDQYVYSKSEQKVIEKHVSKQEEMTVRQLGVEGSVIHRVAISESWKSKQKLSDKYITVLSKTGQIIEQGLKSPQTITWAYESGKIWINFVESTYKKNMRQKEQESLQYNVDRELEKINNNIKKKEMPGGETTKQQNIKTTTVKKTEKDPLLQGKYYYGGFVEGVVSFDPFSSSEDSILVLKGEEEIPAKCKVAGIIVEDESDILGKRLNEYFEVPVITGVPLASKILKNLEPLRIDARVGEIYENKVEEARAIEKPFQKSRENFNKHQHTDTNASIKYSEEVKPNHVSHNVDTLLDLINEDASTQETILYANNVNNESNNKVTGVTQRQQDKMLVDPIEDVIKKSEDIPSDEAVESIENILEFKNDIDNYSKEISFDREERYIEHVGYNADEPAEEIVFSQNFIPTATKVYVSLIDTDLDSNLVNYDGVVLSSTYDIEPFAHLLSNVAQRAGDKEVIVVTPPYEVDALISFFEKIYNLRARGYRNISVILPDYRNKSEIIEFKRLLSGVGLRRSSSFKVYINISRMINVFRLEELESVSLDGVFVDLFRLKMNMLGVENQTASTKFVMGMRNLVSYLDENINVEGNIMVSLNGFEMNIKDLTNILDYKFWGVSSGVNKVDEYKKIISSIERKHILNADERKSKDAMRKRKR